MATIEGLWIEPNGTVHVIGEAEHDAWIREYGAARDVQGAVEKGWTVARHITSERRDTFYLIAKDIPTLARNFEEAIDVLVVPYNASAVLGVHTYSEENIIAEDSVEEILTKGVGRAAFEYRMTSSRFMTRRPSNAKVAVRRHIRRRR